MTCILKNTILKATWRKNHAEKPSHCSHFPKNVKHTSNNVHHSPRPQTKPNKLVLSKEKISRHLPTIRQNIKNYPSLFFTPPHFLLQRWELSLQLHQLHQAQAKNPSTSDITFSEAASIPIWGDYSKAGKITCPLPNRKGNTKKSLNIWQVSNQPIKQTP